MDELLKMLVEKFPVASYVLLGLGGLVVIAQVVVALTPSKKDDAVMKKIFSIPVLGVLLEKIAEMAPIKKKDK